MYQNLFDSHTHSENSLDGNHSVIFMVEAAVARDFQGLAVTDHCDCDAIDTYEYSARQRLSAVDVAIAKEAFRRRIIVTNGIELGQPHLNYAGAKAILSARNYDFVLLSLHSLRGGRDLYAIDYAALSERELHSLMDQYFDEMMEILRWGEFDCLAHLTLPLRYLARDGVSLDLARYTDRIDLVLRTLVENGKALELNTSGLRGKLGDTLPPRWVLRRLRELGGDLVTIGSDAHRAADVGCGIDEGMQLLESCGFRNFTFYRARKPYSLRII